MVFTKYCIVTFEEIESAAKALTEKEHKICGMTITVRAAQSQTKCAISNDNNISKSNNNLLQPPDENSPSNIMNKFIVDDYFLNLFEYLSLRDLCSVADVCTTFKRNAQHIFRQKFTKLKLISSDDDFEVIIMQPNQLSFEFLGLFDVLERLFRNFGQFIESIDLFDCWHKKDIRHLLATYCSADNCTLTTLKFQQSINVNLSPQLQLIFARLKCLNIGFYTPKLDVVLGACRELIELKINTNSDKINNDTFAQMLQMNQKIKRLELDYGISECYGLTENIFRSIDLYLSDLELLNISCYYGLYLNDVKNNLIRKGGLGKLKSFKFISTPMFPVAILLECLTSVPIENLTLTNLDLDSNIVQYLSKLKKIKRLALYQLQDIAKLTTALSEMNVLTYLRVECSYGLCMNLIYEIVDATKELQFFHCSAQELIIKENDFKKLVGLVRSRGNGLSLSIQIDRLQTLDVSNYIIEANRKWLQISRR